jgi:hemerythrin-like metal-binding protein
MSLISWSEKYATGFDSIDNEHKKLMDLLNKLHDGMMNHKTAEVLGPVLEELIKYTQTHFSHEEKLFAQHKYPQEASHKMEHKKLVEKVVELQNGLKNGSVTVSVGTLNFLRDWLNNHILKTDFSYREFFKEKGIK